MKKSFTLIEIVVTVIVVLILATIAIGGYNKVIDGARQRTSEVRIKGLHAAIEVYALENGTLGKITPEYLEKGYAKIMKESGWLTRASCFLVDIQDRMYAFAVPMGNILDYTFLEKYGIQEKMFTPPDPYVNPGSVNPVSYGINGTIPAGLAWDEIKDDLVLLAEISFTGNNTFNSIGDFAVRYKNESEGMAVTKGRTIVKTFSAGSTNLTDYIKP